jgi:hypothetical protein
MELPQIHLQSTNAKINIQTQKGQQEIQQPPAELSIQQPKAEMEIERTPSRLTIDQTKAREDIDLKSISKRTEEAAQWGLQAVREGTARRIQEGDELMRIENKGNPIAEQAKRHHSLPEHEFGLGWIPSEGSVKINYDPVELDINWKINKPIIEAIVQKPIINYYPGKVDISMQQYQSLKIDFDNLKYVGNHYEQLI